MEGLFFLNVYHFFNVNVVKKYFKTLTVSLLLLASHSPLTPFLLSFVFDVSKCGLDLLMLLSVDMVSDNLLQSVTTFIKAGGGYINHQQKVIAHLQ